MAPARPPAGEAPGEVDVHDVEAARSEVEVERLGVDDHLVPRLHRADEGRVGPRVPAFAGHLDRQRLGRDDGAAPELQHRSAAAPTIASQTSSICTMRSAATLSSGVWLASVPLARSTHSKPRAASALASLPPPVATSRGSWPLRSRASRAISRLDVLEASR